MKPHSANTKQSINLILKRGRIHLDTLPECRYLLQLTGLPKTEIDKIIAHENAHINVAEHFNAIVHGYVFDFSLR